MLMQAVVIEVQWERVLVLDLDTRQQVLVNTPDAPWLRPGDLVRIWYNGVMTRSNPPQIYALEISAAPQSGRPPLPPGTRPPAPCPSNVCPPFGRPPVFYPPVVLPPVVRPPFNRPQPPRPPSGRPPQGRHPSARPPQEGSRPPRNRR